MKFEKEPTDQQLDELLQDVAVPQDLKALLKQIPLQSQQEAGDELSNGIDQMLPASDSTGQLNQRADAIDRGSAKSKTWIGLILAASLIGIGLFVASEYLPNSNDVKPSIAKSDTKTADPEKSLAVAKDKKPEARLLELEIEDRELQSLEVQIHAIEMAQLEARVLRAEQASSFPTNQQEVESIIAAMSEQYSIPLGMPEAKVKSGMAQVIQKFPGTRGAAIASSYLEQAKHN